MGKIYENQTALRFIVEIDMALTNVASVTIKYRDPNGISGSWPAEILDVASGTIYYDVKNGDIPLAGNWVIWPFITFSNNSTVAGTPNTIKVYKEGT